MVMPALVDVSDLRENVHHFKRIAAGVGLPVIIHNNLVRYRADLRPAADHQPVQPPRRPLRAGLRR